MSAPIKANIDTLRVLSKASKKLRDVLIDNSKPTLLKALCEITSNLLEGNIKLTPRERKILKRYHSVLHRLAQKSVSLKQKKQLLKQKGGFLTTLLPPALALLATLLT